MSAPEEYNDHATELNGTSEAAEPPQEGPGAFIQRDEGTPSNEDEFIDSRRDESEEPSHNFVVSAAPGAFPSAEKESSEEPSAPTDVLSRKQNKKKRQKERKQQQKEEQKQQQQQQQQIAEEDAKSVAVEASSSIPYQNPPEADEEVTSDLHEQNVEGEHKEPVQEQKSTPTTSPKKLIQDLKKQFESQSEASDAPTGLPHSSPSKAKAPRSPVSLKSIEATKSVPEATQSDGTLEEPAPALKPTHESGSSDLPPRDHIRTIVSLGIPEDLSPPEEAPSLLIAAKQNDISIKFDSKDASQRSAIELGVASTKKIFNQIKSTIGQSPELLGGIEIDWAFWSRVVDDYDDLVRSEPQSVQRAVADGIPMEIRGIVWQLVSRSKNLQLEELYLHLKLEPSVHERAIKRDLSRTSFFTNVNAANKADELFNVIKAYSLFDPDVGYTQGMVFIVVPLVMNMNEAECFSLFVTLMKDYGLRDLFCPDMHGLHLLLHQFDRLLEQNLPILYNHLVGQGVRLLMYASQWFLTFFSYKFPLDVVLRIFDMVITQGIEAILQLAVNLMLKNEPSLLSLHFDALLDFLKVKLFNIYVSDEFVKSPEKTENKRFSLLGRKPKPTTNYYKLDAFVKDAMLVEILPGDLNRFKLEFKMLCEIDEGRVKEIEDLRKENGHLRHEIKQLEMEFLEINRDHLHVGLELVDTKVLLPEILGDIDELQSQKTSLMKDVKELEEKVDEGNNDLPEGVDSQIQELLAENAKETERFATLEEKLGELTLEKEKLDSELKQKNGGKKWFW